MDRFVICAYHIFLILFVGLLQAEEITLTDLQRSHLQEEVTLSGFLAKDKVGHWFLASKPNIKSCCVGSQEHVALEGNFPENLINQRVQMKGILLSRQEKYILENPTIVISKKSYKGIMFLLIVACLGLLTAISLKRFRKTG